MRKYRRPSPREGGNSQSQYYQAWVFPQGQHEPRSLALVWDMERYIQIVLDLVYTVDQESSPLGSSPPTIWVPAPEGMSMLAMGTVSPLRTLRMLWNGSRTSPLKLKPKMASTTSSYSSSTIMGCGRGRKNVRRCCYLGRAVPAPTDHRGMDITAS